MKEHKRTRILGVGGSPGEVSLATAAEMAVVRLVGSVDVVLDRQRGRQTDGERCREGARRHETQAPEGRRPAYRGLPQTKSGGEYPGRRGFQGETTEPVQAALDTVPVELRPPFHGMCAEIDCFNQAIRAQDDVTDALIVTARVRGVNSPAHGTPIEPCASCSVVLPILRARYVG